MSAQPVTRSLSAFLVHERLKYGLDDVATVKSIITSHNDDECQRELRTLSGCEELPLSPGVESKLRTVIEQYVAKQNAPEPLPAETDRLVTAEVSCASGILVSLAGAVAAVAVALFLAYR